jgi:hypothetical protein
MRGWCRRISGNDAVKPKVIVVGYVLHGKPVGKVNRVGWLEAANALEPH